MLSSMDTVLIWSGGQRTALQDLSMSGHFCVVLFTLYRVYKFAKLSNAQKIAHQQQMVLRVPTSSLVRSIFQFYDSRFLLCFCATHPIKRDNRNDLYYVHERMALYCRDCQKIVCVLSDALNQWIVLSRCHEYVLDKPNMDMLAQLGVHTIAVLRHVLLVSELVLEMSHKKCKKWLDTNTSHHSHISEENKALARNWQAHRYAL